MFMCLIFTETFCPSVGAEMPLSARMLKVINFNAVPMVPLDDDLSISPVERHKKHEEINNRVKQNPPCIFW